MSREQSDHALVEQFERELQRALAIEPSPDFAHRVRRRIGQTSVNPLAGRVRWLVPLAAAAACAVAIGIGWQVAKDSPDHLPSAASTRIGHDVVLNPASPRTRPQTRIALARPPVRAAVMTARHDRARRA